MESFWDRFGVVLGSFWDRLGIVLGRFGIVLCVCVVSVYVLFVFDMFVSFCVVDVFW